MTLSQGFPPIARGDARVLILGSLPGARSIEMQQYYAHPQNAFWKIMRDAFAIDGDYVTRCQQLVEHRIALWDVLHSSVRPGSMDADIRLSSAGANDFATFLHDHTQIRLMLFNGKTAQQLFARFVATQSIADGIQTRGLPSTSPAYAAMPFSDKLEAWRTALTEQQEGRGGES